MDAARDQGVEQRQEMLAFVLVSGPQANRERQPGRVYDEMETTAGAAAERARDLLAPFFASTSEASTITRDHSSRRAPTKRSCRTARPFFNRPPRPPPAPAPPAPLQTARPAATPPPPAGRSRRWASQAPDRAPPTRAYP